jgi:hypothetical protein
MLLLVNLHCICYSFGSVPRHLKLTLFYQTVKKTWYSRAWQASYFRKYCRLSPCQVGHRHASRKLNLGIIKWSFSQLNMYFTIKKLPRTWNWVGSINYSFNLEFPLMRFHIINIAMYRLLVTMPHNFGRNSVIYCHVFGVSDYIWGMDWWMDLLATYIHHLELYYSFH